MKNLMIAPTLLLALSLPVACQDGQNAPSAELATGTAIHSWDTSTEEGQPVLRALDEAGDVVAEMVLVTDEESQTADRVTLSFSIPESGDVVVNRDGSIEGEVAQPLLDIADAAYRAFPSADVVIPEADLDGNVEKATATGSFRREGGLLGTSGSRTVGSLCPPGEERRAFRVDEIDEPLFGGSCDGEGFRTSNVNDCRIVIGYTVAALSAVRCEWEVTSR